MNALVEENRELFGDDWWPYGVSANRTAIPSRVPDSADVLSLAPEYRDCLEPAGSRLREKFAGEVCGRSLWENLYG